MQTRDAPTTSASSLGLRPRCAEAVKKAGSSSGHASCESLNSVPSYDTYVRVYSAEETSCVSEEEKEENNRVAAKKPPNVAVEKPTFAPSKVTDRKTRHTLSPASPAPSHSTPTLSANTRIKQSTSMQFPVLQSPRGTPGTGRLMNHAIPHVWTRRSGINFKDITCSFCRRPLGSLYHAYEKCRSCRWRVHTHCKPRVGDYCGLTADHLRAVLDEMVQRSNQDSWFGAKNSLPLPMSKSMHSDTAFQYPDTSIGDSSSSTNSSAPSTPAMMNLAQPSPYLSTLPSRTLERKFTFPDSVPELPDIVLAESADEKSSNSLPVESEDSQTTVQESSNTAQASPSIDGDDTAIPFAASDGSRMSHTWDRNRWNMSTIRGQSTGSSWTDVTIPLQNIEFRKGERTLIGKGRFGEVRRGNYFGDVAVKFLNMEHVDEMKRLEEFKKEVANFKSVRHDNIVMFMGFCFDEHSLGIVTGLCKGRSLYSILYEQPAEPSIDFNTTINIALQICQAVSYLHTKKIVHRDLRTKNIFVEGRSRILVTDIGLISMQRMSYPPRKFGILTPSYWLPYLAPELIREISGDYRELSFSEQSDVFAFGTIWFELVKGKIPWKGYHPDLIVWRVGNGCKPPLEQIVPTNDLAEILCRCWKFNPFDRPSFPEIVGQLQAIPKVTFERSPSHPGLRSFESII